MFRIELCFAVGDLAKLPVVSFAADIRRANGKGRFPACKPEAKGKALKAEAIDSLKSEAIPKDSPLRLCKIRATDCRCSLPLLQMPILPLYSQYRDLVNALAP